MYWLIASQTSCTLSSTHPSYQVLHSTAKGSCVVTCLDYRKASLNSFYGLFWQKLHAWHLGKPLLQQGGRLRESSKPCFIADLDKSMHPLWLLKHVGYTAHDMLCTQKCCSVTMTKSSVKPEMTCKEARLRLFKCIWSTRRLVTVGNWAKHNVHTQWLLVLLQLLLFALWSMPPMPRGSWMPSIDNPLYVQDNNLT